jgi:hypothetical protein
MTHIEHARSFDVNNVFWIKERYLDKNRYMPYKFWASRVISKSGKALQN